MVGTSRGGRRDGEWRVSESGRGGGKDGEGKLYGRGKEGGRETGRPKSQAEDRGGSWVRVRERVGRAYGRG